MDASSIVDLHRSPAGNVRSTSVWDRFPSMPEDTYHIGEVASRTGLSLRTVRNLDQLGVVRPSGRTDGGFRLYREADVKRLLLVRALKPTDLGFEGIRELLELYDRALSGELDDAAAQRLRAMIAGAQGRLILQRERLIAAELAVEVIASASSTLRTGAEEVA
jgi:DNA-binding transcriptional MerR regulator